MNDALVGGDKLAAVLLGRRQAEHMVVLVDGAPHGAQGVVAVGEHIGQGERLHAGGPGGLDDAHIGDVVGGHGVKADGQLLHIVSGIVGLQNRVGHGALPRLFRRGQAGRRAVFGRDKAPVLVVHALTGDLQHGYSLRCFVFNVYHNKFCRKTQGICPHLQ